MTTLLLVVATGLGFLAFFEPCTIATHTLFAARTHLDSPRRRSLAAAQLLLARSGLLALLFAAAAAVGLTALPKGVAMAMLGIIGLVYLVTRKTYLPVPHAEFFRLVPRHDGLAHDLKLGLTLPACTLPLVLIVGMLAALTRQPAVAALAGLLFATTFTLPTLWGCARGLDAAARHFLGKAATLSPYLTSALLWSAAIILWQSET